MWWWGGGGGAVRVCVRAIWRKRSDKNPKAEGAVSEKLGIAQLALLLLINLCIACAGVWISVRIYGVRGCGGVEGCLCVCV